MTDEAPSPEAARLARARRLLAAGGVTIAAGLALAGTMSRSGGGIVLVAGWLVMIAGIHLFGRSG